VPALSYAETVRIGLPTKTYWPTTVAEAAVHQKLFEKEGITAELTIYRGGAECFEALAAGAADVILDAPSLPSAGRKKGVMSKLVAGGAMGSFGWKLMVPAKSTLTVADLAGKKVAITSAGSGSDLLALWTIAQKKIDFTRVPVGGGGLVPNLLAGNVEAAVKWRFLDEGTNGFSVSTFPRVILSVLHSSVRRGLADDGTRVQFPVQVARKFGRVGLDLEFGPVLSSVGRSEWLYGIVGGTDVTKTTELMAELHGTARTSFARDVLTVNVGIRQKLNDQAILIASLGHEVRTPADQPHAFIGYGGVQ
jgi:hypothetical protein